MRTATSLPLSLCTAVFLLAQTAAAQPWIDKIYSYDSLLNLRYGTAVGFNGQTDTLLLDLYLPANDDPSPNYRRPLLLWVHGGAFLAGSKDDLSIARLCKAFAQRGYATASINYRLGFVSDDIAWSCNYPNYSCVFATDSLEWHRALYRGIQDGKGALRYLLNRHAQYRLDTSNVFVAGESAGAFVALGIALLDTTAERLPATFALADVPKPSANTFACQYNLGKTFSGPIARPDLGGIHGAIEPSSVCHTIKGVGNMYGAMANDLLRHHPAGKFKPGIYSFHQPCDPVVPIDQARVYAGLSWCLANCYNCYGIANTPTVYGSRAFSNWNTQNNYGYTIQNEFAGPNFPFNCLFGAGSCADQINNPCHAYDNAALRENNLAVFFAGLIPLQAACSVTVPTAETGALPGLSIRPNPTAGFCTLTFEKPRSFELQLLDAFGRTQLREHAVFETEKTLDLRSLPPGMYYLWLRDETGRRAAFPLVKQGLGF